MEVRLFPNSRRPGVGLQPRRESTRPMLPQHSRHCPVLEAGSGLGFMVYAPLEPKESVHVEYEGDGIYKDPVALDQTYRTEVPSGELAPSGAAEGGAMAERQIPLRRAMNALLLEAYVAENLS